MNNPAALSSLLAGTPGVLDTLVCDRDGTVLQTSADQRLARESAAALALVAGQLEQAGQLLALGACQLLAVKGHRATRLLALHPHALAAVTCEGKRPTADLEARLLAGDWVPRPAIESAVTAAVASAEPAPRSGRESLFTGQLQLFCVPDLLEFLRNARRSGRLICESLAGVGVVRMQRGMVTGAWSPRVARLGEYLVQHAVVTPEQVRAAVQAQHDDQHDRRPIGRVLIEQQAATAGDVRTALVAQVQDAIREMKDWSEGQFTFEPEAPHEAASTTSLADLEIELDPQSILLTIFKEDDEKSAVS